MISLPISGPLGMESGLLRLAKAGDAAAFERILAAWERPIRRVCTRILGNKQDAEDASQEVFLKLHKNLRKIEESVGPWLYRVAVNECRDRLRSRRDETPIDFDLVLNAPGPEALAGVEQRKRIVLAGLATLPEKERAALVLREVEGLSTREVAEILESSEQTVRSQICTARIKLKKFTDRMTRKPL